MIEDIQVKAQINNFSEIYPCIEFIMRQRQGDRRVAFAKPIIMTVGEPPFVNQPPTFSLSLTSAQILMDDLWNCGLRPTEARDGNEVIAGLKAHLADVQGEVRYHRLKESPMMEVLVAAQKNLVNAMTKPTYSRRVNQNGREKRK